MSIEIINNGTNNKKVTVYGNKITNNLSLSLYEQNQIDITTHTEILTDTWENEIGCLITSTGRCIGWRFREQWHGKSEFYVGGQRFEDCSPKFNNFDWIYDPITDTLYCINEGASYFYYEASNTLDNIGHIHNQLYICDFTNETSNIISGYTCEVGQDLTEEEFKTKKNQLSDNIFNTSKLAMINQILYCIRPANWDTNSSVYKDIEIYQYNFNSNTWTRIYTILECHTILRQEMVFSYQDEIIILSSDPTRVCCINPATKQVRWRVIKDIVTDSIIELTDITRYFGRKNSQLYHIINITDEAILCASILINPKGSDETSQTPMAKVYTPYGYMYPRGVYNLKGSAYYKIPLTYIAM